MLMQHLESSDRSDDRLIRGLLAFGVALFLRSVEYLGEHVDGDTLVVPNAKATNGRANGETRERSLDSMAPKTKASLVKFLEHFSEAAFGLAIFGFVGTCALASFLERKGRKDP